MSKRRVSDTIAVEDLRVGDVISYKPDQGALQYVVIVDLLAGRNDRVEKLRVFPIEKGESRNGSLANAGDKIVLFDNNFTDLTGTSFGRPQSNLYVDETQITDVPLTAKALDTASDSYATLHARIDDTRTLDRLDAALKRQERLADTGVETRDAELRRDLSRLGHIRNQSGVMRDVELQRGRGLLTGEQMRQARDEDEAKKDTPKRAYNRKIPDTLIYHDITLENAVSYELISNDTATILQDLGASTIHEGIYFLKEVAALPTETVRYGDMRNLTISDAEDLNYIDEGLLEGQLISHDFKQIVDSLFEAYVETADPDTFVEKYQFDDDEHALDAFAQLRGAFHRVAQDFPALLSEHLMGELERAKGAYLTIEHEKGELDETQAAIKDSIVNITHGEVRSNMKGVLSALKRANTKAIKSYGFSNPKAE